MTGGQMPSCLRSCTPGDVVFTEDSSYNRNCHLAGHAIFNYGHLPGAELQDRGGGAWDLGDNPAFPGSVCVTGTCRPGERQENADGHNLRAIKLTLGAKAQGGTRRWRLHPMTVFVYRFAWKLFRLLARSIENEASLRQTHPHP